MWEEDDSVSRAFLYSTERVLHQKRDKREGILAHPCSKYFSQSVYQLVNKHLQSPFVFQALF